MQINYIIQTNLMVPLSGRSTQPKTAGLIMGGIIRRESFFDFFRVIQMHIITRPEDVEFIVERQKRLQQILFVPKPEQFKQPGFGVFHRQEYIMDVDDNSLF